MDKYNSITALLPVLKILSNGEFHSGQSLGGALGVSRAVIWKQIKALQELGVTCYSVKGKGYQIPGGLELLDKQKILDCVRKRSATGVKEFFLHSEIDSTNDFLLSLAREQKVNGVVCLAESQTAGKGRRGREWTSPFGKNIYLSYAVEFEKSAASLEGLSLAVGVSIVKALSSAGVEGVELKWPNDILFDYKKLGGILIEMLGEANGICTVVVGIGINVDMNADEAVAIGQPWIDIKSITTKKELSRNQLVAEILIKLVKSLKEFEQGGFAVFANEWEGLHAYKNTKVLLRNGPNETVGLVQGVDSGGALVLNTEKGEMTFNAGEVSLRPVD